MAVILNNYLLDVVGAVQHKDGEPQVQMTTYVVAAENPEHALRRFFDEEAGEVFYEGEVVDRILIGIDLKAN